MRPYLHHFLFAATTNRLGHLNPTRLDSRSTLSLITDTYRRMARTKRTNSKSLGTFKDRRVLLHPRKGVVGRVVPFPSRPTRVYLSLHHPDRKIMRER